MHLPGTRDESMEGLPSPVLKIDTGSERAPCRLTRHFDAQNSWINEDRRDHVYIYSLNAVTEFLLGQRVL